jgi:hypothetical protein
VGTQGTFDRVPRRDPSPNLLNLVGFPPPEFSILGFLDEMIATASLDRDCSLFRGNGLALIQSALCRDFAHAMVVAEVGRSINGRLGANHAL